MSDLGVLVPILTPPGTGSATTVRTTAPSSPSVEGQGQALPTETEVEAVDPITGQPTAALSAGLVVVLQDADAASTPLTPGGVTENNPIEEAIDAATAPADGGGSVVAGTVAAGATLTRAPVSTTEVEETTPAETGDEQEDGDAAAQAIQRDDGTGPDGLTEEERRIVAELQRIDAEVRRHEQAHAAVGGPYAGAPAYQTQRGPDGRLYAVGGEVQIDVSDIPGNPAATIRKLQVVRRAALAPSQPSAADRRVASIAQQGIAEARRELQEQRVEEREAASEQRELSAERLQQIQVGGNDQINPAADLAPLRLGIPTFVRSQGPFLNQSQILRVIA